MVIIRKKCTALLLYVLCCLIVILGTGSRVLCQEKKTVHMQLNDCFSFQSSNLSAVHLEKKEFSTGTDKRCPGCLDIHVSILSIKNNKSSLLSFHEVGQDFFFAYQYYLTPYNQVDVYKKYLSSTLLPETASLAGIRTTILLI